MEVPSGVHMATQVTNMERQHLSLLRDASDYIKAMKNSLGPRRVMEGKQQRSCLGLPRLKRESLSLPRMMLTLFTLSTTPRCF